MNKIKNEALENAQVVKTQKGLFTKSMVVKYYDRIDGVHQYYGERQYTGPFKKLVKKIFWKYFFQDLFASFEEAEIVF